MMVTVSVVVPVHNGEDFLESTERQLDAMLAATTASLEVLVIDDHSTDSSLEIVSAWPERYPEVRVLSAEGRGVARARNQAVSAARGQYVWFTDADDTWDPEIVQVMLDAAIEAHADLVVSNATKIFPDGSRTIIEDAPRAELYGARETLERVLDGRLQGHLWNKLFSRATLGNDPFPLTRAHSDLGGVLALIPSIRTTTAVPHAMYDYVIRSGSILNGTNYRWRDLNDCLGIAERVCAELGLSGSRALSIFTCRNIVIPVTNECLRRRDIMEPGELRIALSSTRAAARPRDVAALVRAREWVLLGRMGLLIGMPRTYAGLFRRLNRSAAIGSRDHEPAEQSS